MIQIKFHAYPDGRIAMKVTGHAGSAPKGQDLVCAGVSVLVYTAAQAVREAHIKGKLQSEPRIVLQEGHAVISTRPCVAHRSAVRGIFHTVRCGMEVLAGQFPEYVCLSGNV